MESDENAPHHRIGRKRACSFHRDSWFPRRLGGIALSNEIGSWFPIIAGGALLLFGLYHVIQQLRGHGHGHSHSFGGHSHAAHEHPHDHDHHAHGAHDQSSIAHFHSHEDDGIDQSPNKSDWGAIVSLLALLTFSPCEGFLPVYVSALRYGWTGFVLLTLILSVATVAGMIAFTWLAFAGMEKLKLQFLEKYESGLLGGLLCVLGLLIMFFEK